MKIKRYNILVLVVVDGLVPLLGWMARKEKMMLSPRIQLHFLTADAHQFPYRFKMIDSLR